MKKRKFRGESETYPVFWLRQKNEQKTLYKIELWLGCDVGILQTKLKPLMQIILRSRGIAIKNNNSF
jgi:hypothetical protein